MTAGPRLVQLPIMPGNSLHTDKVDSILVYTTTDAEAIAIAKNIFNYNVDAMWDAATVTLLAAATDMTGWKARVQVLAPTTGVTKADVTVSAGAAQFATLALTIAGGQPADTQTVVIDGKTYTFQTSLTNVDGHVLIGVDPTACALNLFSAITLAAGAGTLYATATVGAANVTATNPSAGVVNVIAKVAGVAGNSIAVSETCDHTTWAGGGTVLAGGVDAASLDGLGDALVVALNASTGSDGTAHITHAAYVLSTHTLTIAGTADTLGDHTAIVNVYPPSGSRKGVATFVGTITNAGSSGSALTVVLTVATVVPSAPIKLASHPFV